MNELGARSQLMRFAANFDMGSLGSMLGMQNNTTGVQNPLGAQNNTPGVQKNPLGARSNMLGLQTSPLG
eukprot:6224274-Alexandrium_andersonii.AAC.1